MTSTRPTLVLGAVPWEIAPIEEALSEPRGGEVEGIAYTRGKLGGIPIVVSLTGVGKTNTGLVLGVLSNEFRPKRVLFTGTGARVRPEIKTGFIIVAEETFFHDAGNLSEKGMQPLPVFGPGRGVQMEPTFRPDPDLFATAMKVAARYEPAEMISMDGESYRTEVRAGRITTGDLFSVNEWKLNEVGRLEADLLEMEGAAVGQACQVLGTPWLLIRGGSDLLRAGDASADYLKAGPIAPRQAALFTLAVLRELAASDERDDLGR
jgi:nucleoside phosphorylase